MKKREIVKKSTDFKKILDHKKVYRNEYYNIYIERNSIDYNRFGISVSKKIGNAVKRNRLKRQIKNIIDDKKSFQNHYDYIIIMKRSVIDASYDELKDKLLNLINKIDQIDQSEE